MDPFEVILAMLFSDPFEGKWTRVLPCARWRAAFLSPTARFAQFFATPCGRSKQFLRFLLYKAQFFLSSAQKRWSIWSVEVPWYQFTLYVFDLSV